MSSFHFFKYEASGNDFILVDARHDDSLCQTCHALAQSLCDRHFGIGADGILVITQTLNGDADMDAAMHIFNADGSQADMCGNGIRCVARYLYKFYGFDPRKPLRIGTRGGLQTVKLLSKPFEDATTPWQLEVEMAHVSITQDVHISQNGTEWHGQSLDVGNPHAVFEVDSPHLALQNAGQFLSNHPTFPDRANIEFIHETTPGSIALCVFERGVGPTLACGTGCVAAAVSYASTHQRLGSVVQIHTPGGDLSVDVPASLEHVRLRGPARLLFEGKWRD